MNDSNPLDAPGNSPLRTPQLGCREAFRGNYLSIDVLEYQGDPPAVREVVRVASGVCVLGVDREGYVSLVRQFRQAIDRVILELPAGVREPGEDSIATAPRELSEETGLVGGAWRHLLRYAQAEGYCEGWMDLFLAQDCDHLENHPDPGEDLEVVTLPVAEFYAMLDRGVFVDAKTILAGVHARILLTERWAL